MSADTGMRRLPGIDRLLDQAQTLVERYGRAETITALREVVAEARAHTRAGAQVPADGALVAQAERQLSNRWPRQLRPLINATGVVIHTNLGRAPLSGAARRAIQEASGYCDLEYDLQDGSRGSRDARLGPLLAAAAGAEAGLAVNNAAAALVLALAALASGRDVPVSRGELIEIGGSFRLPTIMEASGAHLVEVGTTNRTRPDDYLAGDDPGAILKLHPSNYRIVGFTATPTVAEVAAVAHERGVPLIHDVGSGLLQPTRLDALADEPSVSESLHAGADLVICSGDKLLGGPQAGLLVGGAELVERCRRHPLARALRLDKLRIAALHATLEAHVTDHGDDVPIWAMLTADPDALRERSERLKAAIGGVVEDAAAPIGGGTAPGGELLGPVVRLMVDDPTAAAHRLRLGDPPIVVRVEDDQLVIDLRTVSAEDDDALAAALAGLATRP